jgi:hypothetical protein
LAVLDGFQAMEGPGPLNGDLVEWDIALAGTDALAVDSLMAHLMGFDPADIGYLNYCHRLELGRGAINQIEVLGNVAPNSVRRRFRPHPTYKQQCRWSLADIERWLQPAPFIEADSSQVFNSSTATASLLAADATDQGCLESVITKNGGVVK